MKREKLFFILLTTTAMYLGYVNLFAQPTIIDFAPAIGTIGTVVTITGTNFDPVPANNIIYFGATKAIVSNATASQLTVVVPAGATYQPITVVSNGMIAYSKKPFTVTFNGESGFNSGSFASKINFPTAQTSNKIYSGDIDGDGLSDLIITSSNNPTEPISILRNISNTNGLNFESKLTLPLNFFRTSASLGDLNIDGKTDLVVADSVNGTISVFLNSSNIGRISFEPQININTGQNPSTIAIADIDIDGKADIVSVNYNSITVFRNNSIPSTLSFASPIVFQTGLYSNSIAISDFDSDGKSDIAVSNYNSNNISVFKNISTQGTIKFEPKVDYGNVNFPRSIIACDIDNDSKIDLAFINSFNFITVFRNKSELNQIKFEKNDINSVGGTAMSVSDLDGDGKVDLITTTSFDSNSILVQKNTSTLSAISFGSEGRYATTASLPSVISIVDLDNDGKSEIVVPIYSLGQVEILKNTIRLNQVITFNAPDTKTHGDVPFNLLATSSSGLPITFSSNSDKISISGNQVQLLKPGMVTIAALQSGNSNFVTAPPVHRTFCVRPAKPLITVTNINSDSPRITSSSAVGNQWFLNDALIFGSTGQTIAASQSGNYKVQVIIDNCFSDFSISQTLIITGDITEMNSTGLFPNPAADWLTIQLGEEGLEKDITLFDSQGKVLDSSKFSSREVKILIAEYEPGLYIVKSTHGNISNTMKFIKN